LFMQTCQTCNSIAYARLYLYCVCKAVIVLFMQSCNSNADAKLYIIVLLLQTCNGIAYANL
jgi:hypothetical protein